jgi:hypothetical protein
MIDLQCHDVHTEVNENQSTVTKFTGGRASGTPTDRRTRY